jgi:hypothetical protein
MATPLAPCPSCTRHVRVSETLCPFCATTLPTDIAARGARPRVATRLARAGIFAVGTAVAAATSAACSSAPGADAGGMPDMTVADTGPGGLDAAYGGPPDLGPVDMGPGGIDAAYGGPPDLGTPDTGPATIDASQADAGEDLGGVHTLYGLPPSP